MKFFRFLSIILTINLILFQNISHAKSDSVIDEYKKGNIQKALNIAEKKKYKHLSLFLTAQKHIYGGHDTSFEKIVEFLDEYPNWPQRNALVKSAEKRLNHLTSRKVIREWFDENKPQTGKGYYYYYLASKGDTKNEMRFKQLIKNTWIFAQFPDGEEKKFFKKYSYLLNEEDHELKISEYYWKGEYKCAKKYLSLLKKDYKQVFKAWDAINTKSKYAEKEFRRVKGSYRYSSGLLYAYLDSHKKDEPNKELVTLLKKAPIHPVHSKKWWKLKHYYARELIERKRYAEAYEIVSKHIPTTPVEIVEAEWLSGWLAFRFMNKPETALSHFEQIYTISKTSLSLSRGAYWCGRVLESMKKKDEAYIWYKKAAAFGFTFYGQLAQYELRYKKVKINDTPTITNKDKSYYRQNPYADISVFLAKAKQMELLKIYAREAFYFAHTPGEVTYILQRIRIYLNTTETVNMAKIAQQAGVIVKDAAFPTPYKFPKWVNNKIFSYSIMRQESVFNKKAVSAANARGLMQFMPKTAKSVAKMHKIRYSPRKLFDAQYNMKLGSLHLKDLFEEYKSYPLVAANYNAGPVVNTWLKRMDDIRKMKLYNAIDWIESVPYYETRDYIQRVIENMQIYKTILDNNDRLITHRLVVH